MSNYGDTDCCENCSSNFGIFKRKKVCSMCNQTFCQSCVNRRMSDENSVSSSTDTAANSSDRICFICQSICSPYTTTDDLMKLKLKHLKCFLACANIPIGTCKDKRDLAELIMRNHHKFRQRAPSQPPFQQQQGGSQFNSTINNFMNNVQDFVNFNINPLLNHSSSSSGNQQANAQPQSPNTNNSSSNTFSSQSTQQQQSTSPPNGGLNYTIPSNLNSVFSFIGEQFPNVIQQTLNNTNLFNFSNSSSSNSSSNSAAPSSSSRTSGTNRGETTSRHRSNISTSEDSTNRQPNEANLRSESILNRTTQNEPSQTRASETSTSGRSSSSDATARNGFKRRASLSDLASENEIDELSVKQLKEILAANFVEFKGCCERRELVEKAHRLYKSHMENKVRERELNSATGSTTQTASVSSANDSTEVDLCKICMESIIDCVLLDCGHMVSCIKCGKQLAECPICRQNVVRVVRVFKS